MLKYILLPQTLAAANLVLQVPKLAMNTMKFWIAIIVARSSGYVIAEIVNNQNDGILAIFPVLTFSFLVPSIHLFATSNVHTRQRYFQMGKETIAKGSNYRAIRAWLEVDPQ